MIAFGKQCLDPMHTSAQSQFFAGGPVTHVDVLIVFGDWLTRRRQIGIDDQVVVSFAFVDAVFGRLDRIPGGRHAHFHRITDISHAARLGNGNTTSGTGYPAGAAAATVAAGRAATASGSTSCKEYK